MVTSVARKPIKNRTMVICGYYGIVWQKSNIGFWANFQFQNHHPWYKITVSSLLKPLTTWISPGLISGSLRYIPVLICIHK